MPPPPRASSSPVRSARSHPLRSHPSADPLEDPLEDPLRSAAGTLETSAANERAAASASGLLEPPLDDPLDDPLSATDRRALRRCSGDVVRLSKGRSAPAADWERRSWCWWLV